VPVNRVFVVGLPRSGTTWVGHVLGGTASAVYVGEPDNHLKSPFALRAKRRLKMRDFPALVPGSPVPEYELLWASAFGLEAERRPERLRPARDRASTLLLAGVPRPGLLSAVREGSRPGLRIVLAERLAVPERPPSVGATLVVKSVYAPLAVEWIADRFPVQVVVVLREPLNVLSSWSKLEWLGRPGNDMLDLIAPEVRDELATRWKVAAPASGASVVARAAWMIGALTCELSDIASRHDEWFVVAHEELCAGSSSRFGTLADALGLAWTERDASRVEEMNRSGGDFEPFRIAAGLPDAWRSVLHVDQAQEAQRVFEWFPVNEQLRRIGVASS